MGQAPARPASGRGEEASVKIAGGGILVVLFGVALAVAVAGRTGTPPAAGGATPIPADVLALGTAVRAASPDGHISAEDAVAAVEQAWGPPDGGTVEAHLVNLTDPSVMIDAQDVWVVKVGGAGAPFSVPDVPRGIPRPSATAGDVLYHYVDAVTGEWLVARTP